MGKCEPLSIWYFFKGGVLLLVDLSRQFRVRCMVFRGLANDSAWSFVIIVHLVTCNSRGLSLNDSSLCDSFLGRRCEYRKGGLMFCLFFYFCFFTIHFLRNAARQSSHPTFGKDRGCLDLD
jgi:hypothetical protein